MLTRLPPKRSFAAPIRSQSASPTLGTRVEERLAEKVGMDLRSLQRIEAGSWNMTIDYLGRLRAALNCRWRDFTKGMD